MKYQRALKAVWFQKWFVHRRLRPEVMAERVDRTLFMRRWLSGACGDTQLVQRFKSSEGFHAGGQCTVADGVSGRLADASGLRRGTRNSCRRLRHDLKAWFKETTRLVDIGLDPLQPADDGLSLVPYTGSDAGDITVGGELNKIAANVALGRNTAGVHWRSDATESMKLGEAIAIGS